MKTHRIAARVLRMRRLAAAHQHRGSAQLAGCDSLSARVWARELIDRVGLVGAVRLLTEVAS